MVGSSYPGAGENIPSLPARNGRVIKQAQYGRGPFMRPVSFAGPRHDIIMRMKASAVGKVGVEVKRAYLAGLIDGDGCIMATIERHHEKKFGFRVRVEVKITQKESELLKSLAQEFKIGRVSRNNKPSVDYATHDWIIRDKKHVIQILEYIGPYTRLKKKQMAIALRILKRAVVTKQDLIKNAQLADALSKFNVRSKNRRKNFATMI